MIPLFIEYLVGTGKLPLEGLGYLKVNAISAKMDITTRLLDAPREEYVFEYLPSVSSATFFSWLNSHPDANRKTQESFYKELIKNLQQLEINGSIEWKGLGVWKRNDTQNLEFEFKPASFPQLISIHAEKIVRNDAVHAIRVGEQQSDSVEMSKLLSTKKRKKVSILWLASTLVIIVATVLGWFLITGKMHPTSLSNPAKVSSTEGAVQYRSL